MFDLHVHTVFSDGELIPSEIARRMVAAGNEGFAITDHADFSNISDILSKLEKLKDFMDLYDAKFLIGVEVTHVPPELIGKAVELAWREGAEIVVVHGETVVEPVKNGTNFAALNEEITILAHPGLMSEKEAEMARENGIHIEITSRKGHSLTNGYVAKLAEEFRFNLVINTDAHSPSDIINDEMAEKVLRGAGVEDWREALDNNRRLFRRLRK
ncbi:MULTISPECIES: histidinol phosphate phosphatase domain-containing protein [unclassified Archaeoglobus]|jgi:histidinol phosphatase-like PHP family hydrolase|uniref:histidinol phosphate phosphatase domain-containing protein n=1 Tax=unclassified Archaeoglobus TaxID=2643606 RepID=UPI0025C08E19|nr:MULTISPECIES: histidinol phosphate phosphatase domain-containing protein [unclassified Archaeoglobus]